MRLARQGVPVPVVDLGPGGVLPLQTELPRAAQLRVHEGQCPIHLPGAVVLLAQRQGGGVGPGAETGDGHLGGEGHGHGAVLTRLGRTRGQVGLTDVEPRGEAVQDALRLLRTRGQRRCPRHASRLPVGQERACLPRRLRVGYRGPRIEGAKLRGVPDARGQRERKTCRDHHAGGLPGGSAAGACGSVAGVGQGRDIRHRGLLVVASRCGQRSVREGVRGEAGR